MSQVFCHKLFTFCNQVGRYKLQLYDGDFFLHFCQNCPMVKFRYPETATKIWKNSSLFLTLLGNFKNRWRSFKFSFGLLTISEFWLKSVIFSSALLFIKIFSHIFELTYLVSRQNKTWIYINGDFEFQWFRDEVSKEEQMPEELLSLLFSHLDPIYELHCSFLKDIEQRMATW